MNSIICIQSRQFLCAFFALLIFAVCSCQTSKSSKKEIDPRPDLLTVTNAHGLSLKAAQEKSLNLAKGMTREEVQLQLCEPDRESPQTFFPQGSNPWNGIVWSYHWGPGVRWFDRPNPNDTLKIIFEKHAGDWVVNFWIWSGP